MRNWVMVALLALALPAAAVAEDDGPGPMCLAKTAFKSEKAQMGARTFKAVYAAGTASGATKLCVDKRDGGAATDVKNAAKACKAERAADPAAFTAKWGTNKNHRNAYGKCVSATARGQVEQTTEARVWTGWGRPTWRRRVPVKREDRPGRSRDGPPVPQEAALPWVIATLSARSPSTPGATCSKPRSPWAPTSTRPKATPTTR